MNVLDRFYLRTKGRLQNFMEEEQGESNIIAIVIVLGVVVTLAITFGGKLTGLFNGWWDKIRTE